MKHLRALISVIILFSFIAAIFSPASEAHMSGPPYILINKKYANTNPTTTFATELPFPVGLDAAPEKAYILSEVISFSVDEERLLNPFNVSDASNSAAMFRKPDYRWDFADGTVVDGKDTIHTYTKAGTYIVKFLTRFLEVSKEYAETDSIQITVIPDKGYRFPKAVMLVNDKVVKNPYGDLPTINVSKAVKFDASKSEGKIRSYLWYLDDGTTSRKSKFEHKYKNVEYLFSYYPVLRVIDENGIISDTPAALRIERPKLSLFKRLKQGILAFFAQVFHK